MDTSQTTFTRDNEKCWYKDVCTLDHGCKMCIKYAEMSFLMESSLIPVKKRGVHKLSAPDCDKEAYTQLGKIKSDIVDFVNEGGNLYIGSEFVGNGKTTWAIKMMQQYFDDIWDGNCFEPRALFINVPKFLSMYKNYNVVDETFEKLKKDLYEIDLVVWDDIGSTSVSAHDMSILYAYIDYRSLAELANIYTGNYATKEDLATALGDRMASRIWRNKNGQAVIFKGGDLR